MQNQQKQYWKHAVQNPNEHVSQNTNVVQNCIWCTNVT